MNAEYQKKYEYLNESINDSKRMELDKLKRGVAEATTYHDP